MDQVAVFVPVVPRSKNWNDPITAFDLTMLRRGRAMPSVPFLRLASSKVVLSADDPWEAAVAALVAKDPDAVKAEEPVKKPVAPAKPKKAAKPVEPEDKSPAVQVTETDQTTTDDTVGDESKVVADTIEIPDAIKSGSKIIDELRAKALSEKPKEGE